MLPSHSDLRSPNTTNSAGGFATERVLHKIEQGICMIHLYIIYIMTNSALTLHSVFPEDICNHIYEFYHPYKHAFTNNIISTHEIWKRTWIRFHQQQIDPKIKFVMEYMLKEINVYPSDLCDSMDSQISLFPDTCSIGYYPNRNISSIVIVQMGSSDEIFKEFELFTTKQYKQWGVEECSSTNHKITVHWNEQFWLVKTL